MADKIQLDIITPERVLFSGSVDEVVAPGHSGEFGVLPEHTPFLSLLEIGVLKFSEEGREKKVAVTGGFSEVLDNRVRILARTAEFSDEIDRERAKKALSKAEEMMKEISVDDKDYKEFEAKIRRAMMRLGVSG